MCNGALQRCRESQPDLRQCEPWTARTSDFTVCLRTPRTYGRQRGRCKESLAPVSQVALPLGPDASYPFPLMLGPQAEAGKSNQLTAAPRPEMALCK
ncbi:hypothetical protein AAFF_G00092600 [Aldrovandia affinis]|uniref:Uncharacterized protein n=1 Tax=Aldrovandia affinis TaxID=143900 RepID=A0AAD7WYV8_9TELE|nr:hypothetical protein AAFF_G00092600 [Aldrovandia affinis]